MTTRGAVGRWAARIAALLATAALLGVGVAIATMVRPDSESKAHDQAVTAEPTPTPSDVVQGASTREADEVPARRARGRRGAAARPRLSPRAPGRLARAPDATRAARCRRAPAARAGRSSSSAAATSAPTPTTPSAQAAGGAPARALGHARLLGLAPGRQACCPHGGTARVRFRWDGGRLTPRGAIPDAALRRPAGAESAADRRYPVPRPGGRSTARGSPG